MRTVEQMEAHEQLHETIDAQDALINKQRALIKQLGEALASCCDEGLSGDLLSQYTDAITAYNNWKRERGE